MIIENGEWSLYYLVIAGSKLLFLSREDHVVGYNYKEQETKIKITVNPTSSQDFRLS